MHFVWFLLHVRVHCCLCGLVASIVAAAALLNNLNQSPHINIDVNRSIGILWQEYEASTKSRFADCFVQSADAHQTAQCFRNQRGSCTMVDIVFRFASHRMHGINGVQCKYSAAKTTATWLRRFCCSFAKLAAARFVQFDKWKSHYFFSFIFVALLDLICAVVICERVETLPTGAT